MEVEEDEEEPNKEGNTSYLPPKESEIPMIKSLLHATKAQFETS